VSDAAMERWAVNGIEIWMMNRKNKSALGRIKEKIKKL